MAESNLGRVGARLEAALGRVVSFGGAQAERLNAAPFPDRRSRADARFDLRREGQSDFDFPHARVVAPEIETQEPDDLLPRLPEPVAGQSSYVGVSFLICVLIPAICIFAYYGLFAADQYVSEFKFSVTESTPVLPSLSPAAPSNTSNGSSAIAGIASAFTGGTVPASLATSQNYIVVDYLMSRQAIDDLQKKIKVKTLFEPDSRWDWWAGFKPSDSSEDFLRYWSNMVSATYDPITGIATVRVRAFTREKSLLIANALVKLAEDLVNGIARRPQLDAIKYTEGEVARAEAALDHARSVLEQFRQQEGVIEPSASVSTNSELVKALKANLVQLRTEYSMLTSQRTGGAASVTAGALASRISATERQLEKLQFEVSKDNQDGRKLMKTVARYEKLDLDRQYAQAMVMSTRQAYDQARANAAAQHLYLTPFVRPSLPESAGFPKRTQASLLRISLLLGLWIAGMMLVQAVREHLHV